MDSNKDEGLRCMRIAKNALESGDKARALKFFNMAKRMYPNPQVDAFLRELAEGEEPIAAKKSDSETDSKYQAGTANGAQEGVHGRASGMPRSRSGSYTAESNGNEPERSRNGIPRSRSTASLSDATPEQIEIVRRIRRTKDYYEILGLTKTCSEGEIRKAYRKLSLKVHPDKNNAPGAEEAFKAVSKSFQVLSDADLRDKYDRDGPEEEIQQHVRHRHSARQYRGSNVYYEDVFDANDIFNSFFFGMQQQNGNFRRAHFVRTQPQYTQRGEAHSINLLSLLQLLPILILLIVSLFPFSQPVFNLMSVAPYQIQRNTADRDVPYYVKSHNFDKDYPPGSPARRKIEQQVESEYKDILVQNCRMELGMRRWGQSSATPNCDRLDRFQRL